MKQLGFLLGILYLKYKLKSVSKVTISDPSLHTTDEDEEYKDILNAKEYKINYNYNKLNINKYIQSETMDKIN